MDTSIDGKWGRSVLIFYLMKLHLLDFIDIVRSANNSKIIYLRLIVLCDLSLNILVDSFQQCTDLLDYQIHLIKTIIVST